MDNPVIERECFKSGDIIRHFKRYFCTEEEKKQNKYIYEVIGIAFHSETNKLMLVYKALYFPFEMYVRPLDMAMSLTDKEKYPNAKQKFRFELFNFSKED